MLCKTCGRAPDFPDALTQDDVLHCYGCMRYLVPAPGSTLAADLDDYKIAYLDPDGELTRDSRLFEQIVGQWNVGEAP